MPSDQPLREPATRPRPGRLLGDVLVSLGFCDRDTVEDIVSRARAEGRPMGQLLIERGLLDSGRLAIAIAERFGLQSASLETLVPDAAAMALVSPAALRRLEAVPVGYRDSETLLVAMSNPSNVLAIDDLAMLTDLRVEPLVVSPEDLDVLLGRLDDLAGHAPRPADAPEVDLAAAEVALESLAQDSPTLELVRSIVSRAVDQGATDVHLDPDARDLRVRHRIDGLMTDGPGIPRRQAARVISQIKILGELDVAERRLPQEGRATLVIDGRRIDLRVSTVPLVEGEAIVLHLLDPDRRPQTLADLGMGDAERERVEAAVARSHGAILVSGPAGSGTSATLHAALDLARSPARTVMTIEDPVEYRLAGVRQIQVRERAGLTFAAGLRASVRADADVILAGALHDPESARIAIDAALGGRLVLSALHAQDAPAAAAQLAHMGVDPYLLASALSCVVAQRLARRLCPHCRRPVAISAARAGLDSGADVQVFEPAGCRRCRDSGYSGRIGLFEVMPVSDEIRALILERAPVAEIRRTAVEQGMRTLLHDGLEKMRAGETALAEVVRVTA
ncbi:MAG: type pilus assembly protein PilB [Solirubrobacteraceae bacterium]|jgi:type IV pilus assembly protein PilB|nr:type pilus assembly protein PilB [Solirubrobacteraceae bacterium]